MSIWVKAIMADLRVARIVCLGRSGVVKIVKGVA
jgi:hypothetical protein